MNKQHLLFFAAIIITLLVIVPSVEGSDSKNHCTCPNGYLNVTASEAEKVLERGNSYLLDVRIPTEYNYAHIEGASLIPLRNALGSNLDPSTFLENRTDELPRNKNTKIIVYCKAGTRSAPACDLLVNLGYKKVYNIPGGITEWVNTGYPVIVDPTFWTANYPKTA